ncbi:MAG TPA: amidohydrolase family protein [Candidatus Saccharimonadales bacterium]|nr:amidohydrolase family protein [Candidatus Saccharimonadales bacterium]
MRTTFITNVRLVFPGERITPGSLLLRNGQIAALNPAHPPPDAMTIDGGGGLLTPGLIDIHTHGIQKFRYHYDTPREHFEDAFRLLGQYGTTTVFPTIVPADEPNLAANLSRLTAALPHGVGLHLEGPFLALGGAACATLPGDLKLLDEILAACANRLAIMSISPDQKKILPVIERLRERGIAPFMTHTRASVEQTQAAIEAGAVHATHFYDVFPAPEETDPGVRPAGAVEAILADRRVSVDFIGDGVHVHPTAIRAALAAKGWQGVILITDSNIGAGLPPGEHDTPWGYKVRVRAGDAARHLTKNFLAGSALTMNAGMKNLLRWLDLPPAEVWAMGTLNPARLLGLTHKGRLAAGADADLVLWDDELLPVKTWAGGRRLYERGNNG